MEAGREPLRTALHLEVRGRVQGVGFRWRARERADALGVDGWVRNRFDGTVEIVAEGPPEAVDSFRRWLAGPGAPGRVEGVVAEERPAEGADGFEIRPTAH